MQHPEVSVVITSYNSEKTICRAITSVITQETTFPFEIIISDDGSTDNTVNVIYDKFFANNSKDYLFFHGFVHRGMVDNYHFAFSQCRGKYIAVCDADDYWIDYLKLQRQYEYMEGHPGCGLCLTRVYTEYDDGIRLHQRGMYIYDINKNFTFDNLLKGCAGIYAQSFFIRKTELYKINLNKLKKYIVWDYPLVLELIQHNYFWCLDFYSAIYVKNEEIATNTRKRGKRLRYILGTYKIRLYFILNYGCKFSTLLFIAYRFVRDCYSITFNRWYK